MGTRSDGRAHRTAKVIVGDDALLGDVEAALSNEFGLRVLNVVSLCEHGDHTRRIKCRVLSDGGARPHRDVDGRIGRIGVDEHGERGGGSVGISGARCLAMDEDVLTSSHDRPIPDPCLGEVVPARDELGRHHANEAVRLPALDIGLRRSDVEGIDDGILGRAHDRVRIDVRTDDLVMHRAGGVLHILVVSLALSVSRESARRGRGEIGCRSSTGRGGESIDVHRSERLYLHVSERGLEGHGGHVGDDGVACASLRLKTTGGEEPDEG